MPIRSFVWGRGYKFSRAFCRLWVSFEAEGTSFPALFADYEFRLRQRVQVFPRFVPILCFVVIGSLWDSGYLPFTQNIRIDAHLLTCTTERDKRPETYETGGTCKWNTNFHSERSNRVKRTTFSEFPFFPQIFQWNERNDHVPEFPGIYKSLQVFQSLVPVSRVFALGQYWLYFCMWSQFLTGNSLVFVC